MSAADNPARLKADIQSRQNADGADKNAKTPVFDAGLAPLGTDDEAGGAPVDPALIARARAAERPETGGASADGIRTSPGHDAPGMKAPPALWYALAAVAGVIVLLAAAASF